MSPHRVDQRLGQVLSQQQMLRAAGPTAAPPSGPAASANLSAHRASARGGARGHQARGVSLTELLIAIAILAILAAAALPAYREQIRKTRRTEATAALTELATRLERYRSERGTYTGAAVAGLRGSDQSENGHYSLSVSALAPQSFSLQATPTSAAQSDDRCGNFTLNSTGERGVSGPGMTAADCW